MRRNRLFFLKKSSFTGIAFALCLTSGILANAEDAEEVPVDVPLLEAEAGAEAEPPAAETEAPQAEAPAPSPSAEEQSEAPQAETPAPAPSTEEQTEAAQAETPAPAPSTEEQTEAAQAETPAPVPSAEEQNEAPQTETADPTSSTEGEQTEDLQTVTTDPESSTEGEQSEDLLTETAEIESSEEEEREGSDPEITDAEETESLWEDGTLVQTEENSESETEPESEEEILLPIERESSSEAQIPGTDPQEDPTLHPIENEEEVAESIEGFSIDISSYPAADTSSNTRYIYQYLTEKMGLNHAAACGVLANIQLESGFNQYALGDGGTSYGICQWHNERFNRLISYCGGIGLDYNTLDGQLAYLANELASSYPNVLNHLLGVSDTPDGAYDAGYYWCVYFEAPSETYARAAQRGNLAKNEYYPLDLSMPTSQSSSPEETETGSEETLAEEALTEETLAEETLPEETVAEETLPEETVAEENVEESRQTTLNARELTEEPLPQMEDEETFPKDDLEMRLERIILSYEAEEEEETEEEAEEKEDDNRQIVTDLRRLLDEKEN